MFLKLTKDMLEACRTAMLYWVIALLLGLFLNDMGIPPVINPVEVSTSNEFNYADKYTVSDDGLELITSFEGLYLETYRDVGGTNTIGWGTTIYGDTGKPVQAMDTITKERADWLLNHDINNKYAVMVKRNIKVKITQSQFDSLVSFTYNLGEESLKKIAQNVNNEDWDGATDRMMKYVWAWNSKEGKKTKFNGLIRRREAEVKMFKGDDK